MLVQNKKKYNVNVKALYQLGTMFLLTILTQLIMLLKTSIVASDFGVSVEMDAYNFANSIGTFIFSFIGSGVTTILIPTLINNPDEDDSVNTFISVLYSFTLILLIVVYINRNALINILSSGNKEFIEITCNIMLITLITQYINSFTSVTNAIFQCIEKFNFPKFISLLTSTLLVILIMSINKLDIYKYILIILFTTIVNVTIQFYLVYKYGYSFKYKFKVKNEQFKSMMRTFMPTVLSVGLYQISLFTDSIISSNLGSGELSKLSYSNNITGLVNMVILANIVTYFYPKIAKNINCEDGQEKLFNLSILVNAIMILLVAGFLIVGRDGIVMLYQRGKFTSSVTSTVFLCTSIYMMGLPCNAFRDLIYRYFYAKGNTKTPLRNSLIVSILNIIISVVLSKYMGIYGIILGTVITSYVSLNMILVRFDKEFKIQYNKKTLLIENLKLILAACIGIYILRRIKNILPIMNSFFNFIIFGSAIVIIYIAIIYLFKSKVFTIDLS